MANTPKFTAPTPKEARPYLTAKLKANAQTSVAAWTGTKSRVTQVSDSATTAQVAAAFAALVDDLRLSGIIV